MVAMTFSHRKQLLWILNIGLAAALLGSVLWGFCLPLGVQVPQPKPKGENSGGAKSAETVKPLGAFLAVSSRDLRKPLFDVDPTQKASDRAKLMLKLVGTVMDPGRAVGIFVNGAGQTKFAKVGETLDGAEITAVTEANATVLYHGETITLDVAKKGGQP